MNKGFLAVRTDLSFLFFFLPLLILLSCSTPAGALQVWSWEKYGFNTWAEGWQVYTNSTTQGATNISQTTNAPGWLLNGAYALQVDLDLRTNPAAKTQGRVMADMATFFPYAVNIPMNLSNKDVYIALQWPATNTMGYPTNRYRFFVYDSSNRCEYFDWTNIGTNGIGIEGNLWKVTATNSGAEAGFDPCKVTKMGLDFAMGAGSTGGYSGPVKFDAIRFDVPPGAYTSPTNERYSFSSDAEGWTYQTYTGLKACTNVSWVSSAPSNNTGCLAVDLHLNGADPEYNEGEIMVDARYYPPSMIGIPVDLKGKRVSMWVHCTNGLPAPESNANYVRLFCKDENWKSFYGSLQHITTTGFWFSISMTPDTNMPQYGWMDSGFDPTKIIMVGLQIAAGGGSTWTFDGKFFVDGLSFYTDADTVNTNELRYDFEVNKEGWGHETYVGITGITAVAQSTDHALHGSNSLRMTCNIVNIGTNRQQGAAKVDMRWYPPPIVRAPFDLSNRVVNAYIFCPTNAQSTNAANPNQVRVYVSDTNWNSQYGTYVTVKGGQWVKASMTVTTNLGFLASQVIGVGVDISMIGTYTNYLYLDEVEFPASSSPEITNSQHDYDFEAACQAEWWKWTTNPEGWDALAWTNVYYATNWGSGGSVALAAPAVFVVGGSEDYRKGVFEIGYQPALNLSTKDHRRIRALMKFEPPVEGIETFFVTLNVFDKITDQWYFKEFNCGGSDWNVLDFDLDNAAEYAATSPAGPMDASSIGFITIQIYANSSWTGTVYVDDVVVGGRETGTNYTKLTGAFVQPAGHKFVVGGTNFYFCGANIEYLQTVPDATVVECLDWVTNTHLQIVRTWAMQEGKPYSFQPQRGVWNELMFEHLDRIVAEAGHRKIRLMLGLCDNWAHNGGIFQYVHWAVKEHPESVNTNLNKEGVEYHDQFWTNQWCKQWYKDYVTRLLNRTNSITGVIYKQDPTVFAFEIVNEPRCESDFSGRTIHNWLNEMSDFVRSIDTNHMLGNGEEGGYVNTYDFADTIPWEVYPDNYYHYATYATGSSTCDLYGCGRGHGVDFLSDNMSQNKEVTWQGGFYTNRDAPQSEWRSGNSNINFCTARIYVDQKEYNVWRTNLNSADQKFEWINDHWYDAHKTIAKPMILEEFGIHAIGWIFNGSYGQVQLVRTPEYTFQDRVNIYSQYYAHIERSGISGSFFWNFGYDGMWDDPFHLCEQVFPWYAETWDGSAKTVTLSSAYFIQGSNSLKMAWDVPDQDHNKAIFRCPTNEKWVLRVDNASTNEPPTHGINRTKFFWNVYNPSTTNISAAISLRGAPNWYWCESPKQSLTQGWNRLMFDLSAGTWSWISNSWENSEYLINIPNSVSNVLEDVHEVNLVFYNLTNGTGEAYVDNIQIKRDDGFVVYADDAVVPVIKAHADWMAVRNIATNAANTAPVASNKTIVADAFRATNVTLTAGDANGDALSFRIITKPTNGWVFGIPPVLVYKSKPGTMGGDLFTFKVHDGKADSAEGTITVNLGSTDTDSDYLPDAWEFIYFPKLVQYWPYDADSLTNMNTSWDWDGDGFADYEEYRAGTSPTNNASYLWVSAQSNNATQFYIRWPGVSGKQYELQKSTNLLQTSSGFTGLASNIWAVEPMNTWTDSASSSGPYLYRIRVQ